MIRGQLMNAEELSQWILRKLGAPQVDVELTQDDLDDAIEDAARWFAARKGFRAQRIIDLVPGQTAYTLPDDVDTIFELAHTESGNELDRLVDPLSLIDGFPFSVFHGAGGSGGLISTYAQTVQYLQMAKRILGSELEWRQDGKILTILPPPQTGGRIIIDYKANTFTIEQLIERDHDLVKAMALTLAKEKLGRVRSKIGSLPGAQGGFEWDGSALLAEVQAEKEKLDQDIALSGYPMAFLIG